MENFVEFIKNIWEYISSAEVLGTISFGSIVTFIVSFFTKNWQIKKANAKYGAKEKEIKLIKEEYDKLKVNSEATIKEITSLYMQAVELISDIHTNAINQNEALKIAFNNSNLKASAQLEVAKILSQIKPIPRANETLTIDTTPIPNAGTMVVEDSKVGENNEIIRIK